MFAGITSNPIELSPVLNRIEHLDRQPRERGDARRAPCRPGRRTAHIRKVGDDDVASAGVMPTGEVVR